MKRIRLKAGVVITVIALGFAFCALWQPTSVIADNQVPRPERIKGDGIIQVDLSNCDTNGYCASTLDSWGESTHAGRYTNVASGSTRLSDLTFFANGVLTAANGDQIFWEENGTPEIVMTGGTGRFQGITGSFAFTKFDVQGITVEYPIVSVMVSFEGEGTITY